MDALDFDSARMPAPVDRRGAEALRGASGGREMSPRRARYAGCSAALSM
jgi:hypothetical protein